MVDEALRIEYAICTEMQVEALKRLEQTPGADLALTRYLCERMILTCRLLGIEIAATTT